MSLTAVDAAELLLALLAVISLLATIARRLRVPYPVLFMVGGVVLAIVPGLPQIVVPPDLIFLLFVPPLIYSASVFTSVADVRANLRPITMLAVGLVVVTMMAVAALAHAMIGLDWAPAFVLGAILAPTDATAALAVTEYLPLPRRVVMILEGEGLFNDAVSLVAFRLAVAAVVSGSFSILQAGPGFVISALGGTAVGLAAGWLATGARRLSGDPLVEITLTLLTPFLAWIPAESLNLSGVLAVVAAGMYIGQERFSEISPATRLRGVAFWDVLTFVLEGLLFTLTGFQLREVLQAVGTRPAPSLLGDVALLSVTVMLLRMAWVFGAVGLARWLASIDRTSVVATSWREAAVIAWTGMRGGEALAPALALPLLTTAGGPFAGRGLIVFMTFGVIVLTLPLQGLSLPVLIRWLGVAGRESAESEERRARISVLRATLRRFPALTRQAAAPPDVAAVIRADLEHQVHDLVGRSGGTHQARDQAMQQLKMLVVAAEREEALRLHDQGRMATEVLRAIEQDLDLDEVQLAAERGDDLAGLAA